MYGNVLEMTVLPIHPLRQVSILLSSVGYNPTRVTTYLIEGPHLPMLIVGASYDFLHGQEIKGAYVGHQYSVTLLRNKADNACQVWGILRIRRPCK